MFFLVCCFPFLSLFRVTIELDMVLVVCGESVSSLIGCLKCLCVFLDKQQAKAENQTARQDIKHILDCGKMRSWQYLLVAESRDQKGLGDIS